MNDVSSMFDRSRPILIIDDCTMYRTATRGMLLKLGFSPEQILLAKDAVAALEIVKHKAVQLILCDYNLGERKNGHQLLDEMVNCQMLSADCVIIIITGDSSASVVRGFYELRSDGYLVKPLNYVTFKERLPKFSRKKRVLADMLTTFSNGDFTDTIAKAEESIFNAEQHSYGAQFLKAKALIQLNKCDEAKNILIHLQGKPIRAEVQIEFARLELKQKQYKSCLATLSPFEKDPIHCTKVLLLSAQCYLAQQQLSLALEKMTESVKHSPRNIENTIFCSHIAMAMFDVKPAYDTLDMALSQSRHSYRETLLLHQMVAQLNLNVIQFTQDVNKGELFARFIERYKHWRSYYSRKDYKPFELLLKARAHGLQGNISQCKTLLNEYLQWQDDEYISSVYELIELANVYSILHDTEKYQESISRVKVCLAQVDIYKQQTLTLYLNRWQSKLAQVKAEVSRAKKRCLSYIKIKEFEKAVKLIITALDLDSTDTDLGQLTIICLSRAWPMGWSKKSVIKLVMRCRELLKNTPVVLTPEYRVASKLLAKQLQVKEVSYELDNVI
ncbi:response regulator [Colwellia piezophila]|uniref:response regulator n=1 Tax=Colwellia piezophila TaxID=211668 RepID=UPI00036729C3|nr:response regulator [Colwellia piezophila]